MVMAIQEPMVLRVIEAHKDLKEHKVEMEQLDLLKALRVLKGRLEKKDPVVIASSDPQGSLD